MQGFARGIPLDTDGTLAANSDGLVSSQKAVKTYVDSIPKPYNYLINGGFDFAQRTTPGTLTTVAADGYGPDRWRMTRETANFQFKRFDATSETGLTSKNYGQFYSTAGGKIHICQIVEGVNSVPLRGKTVIFQAMLKADTNRTYRMAVIQLKTAGTLDTIPGTFCTDLTTGDGVDPTLGTNLEVITAAQSKSVLSASWAQFSVSVTVPTDSKNLICAIWSDATDIGAGGYLNVAEAGLYQASIVQPWLPRLIAEELAQCQRFYQKSYDVDTIPGTASAQYVTGQNENTSQMFCSVVFPTTMRANPTRVLYSFAGTVGKFANSGGSDVGGTCALAGSEFGIGNGDGGGGLTADKASLFNFTASAEL